MSHARKAEILQLAKLELQRAQAHRRTLRHITTACVSMIAIAAVVGGAWFMLSDRARTAPITLANGDGAAPREPIAIAPTTTPEPSTPTAVTDRTAIAGSENSDIPDASSFVASARFEVVHAALPSTGFTQVLDDLQLEIALRSLPKSTGVAVIDGRTRLVSSPEWPASDAIR